MQQNVKSEQWTAHTAKMQPERHSERRRGVLGRACAAAGLALVLLGSQPAFADRGWGHPHGGYQRSWVPFALGAVVGGVAIGAMMQPQPVYAQPIYSPTLPPGYMPPRVVVPAPVYVVPSPPPPVYYSY